MNRLALTDILQLSVAERIQLVEDIWDSISLTNSKLEISETQRKELERRLHAYQLQPNSNISWAEAKNEFEDKNELGFGALIG